MSLGISDCHQVDSVENALRSRIVLLGRPVNWNPNVNAEEVIERIARIAIERDVHNVWMPRPDFSARIAKRNELNVVDSRRIGHSLVKFNMMPKGTSADGVEILGGHAVFIYSADCPTVTLRDPVSNRMIVAHAGRECLYDKTALQGGLPRKHASVIQAMMEFFTDRSRVTAHISLAIRPEDFLHPLDDPNYGQWNARMLYELEGKLPRRTGELDLPSVIMHQLQMGGIRETNITRDNYNTFGDTTGAKKHCEYVWWSNRRNPGTDRNGILIINTEPS